MTDKKLLLSYIVRHGETQEQLAAALGISLSRLSAKINGWKGAQFTQKEMQLIIRRYRISVRDAFQVFLKGGT